MNFTTEQQQRMRVGQTVRIGNKCFEQCSRCGRFVRVDRIILGSTHVCMTERDRARSIW